MPDNLPIVRATELQRALERIGWFERRQSGSHRIFRHPSRQGSVSIPMHTRDVPRGTLRNILRQAGLTGDQLRDLL
jgi:predicted RNA binding protein YcfA (HicA-like mRNA interferase family)